ncbi:MAG: hypothetical protein E7473_11205 [Ruminococcaceae bacterium]|nr:hypothetical protein [Oscillospiraceae bacterium]
MKKIISFLLATVMCLSMFGTVFAAEFNFTDVKTSDWFYNDVKSAVEMGLINGKSPTTYAPNDNLTYAEAIKLAACMNQLYAEGSVTLKNGNPWYQSYVDYCKSKSIITKEYNYNEKATRAGYMEIFAKALPDEALPAINDVPSNSIPDVQMAAYYAESVYKLYRAGILNGVDKDHRANPYANIKRSEVATILVRMMDDTKRVSITDMGEKAPEEANPEATEPEATEPEEKEPEVKEPEETKALTIKTQPVEPTVYAGETATLTVEVEGGKAPYTYQWQNTKTVARSVTTALEDGETIQGATTDTLKITANTAGTTFDISCKITDADGAFVTTESVKVYFNEKSGGAKDKFQQVDTEEPKNEDFAFTINGVYNVASRGIVLTGYISEGKVSVGDTVYLNDADGKYVATTTVKAIEMFSKLLDEAEKGDKPGINVDLDVDTYKAADLTGYVLSATKGTTSSSRPSSSRPSTTGTPSTVGTLKITSQSKDMSGSIGLFKLSVAVEGGKSPYTCQWQKLATITSGNRKTTQYLDLLDKEGSVKGATSANLTLSLTELGTYKYRCIIKDADGNSITSEIITLTVDSESASGRVSIPTGGKTGY